MSGTETGDLVMTVAVTLIGALAPTLPWIGKLRLKIAAIKNLLIELDNALADGKITPAESKAIVATARKVIA